MNAPDRVVAGVLAARLDGGGRLLFADPQLAALNARAGGAIGQPLAVPALATIARLAVRLGIVVSRAVTVADDAADIEMWVRAAPEAIGVRMGVSGWREVAAWRPEGTPREPALAIAPGDWRWETDAGLRLTLISPSAGTRHGFDPFALLGQPLTALFAFDEDGDGLLPILAALAGRTRLEEQPARLRVSRAPLVLSAAVRADGKGVFAGLVGVARSVAGERPIPSEALPARFTEDLDRALRTPLARIVANADSIHAAAEGPIGSDYAGYAADIAGAGRHLLGLVDDLVDLDAIERPGFTLAAESIDLADVARRAAGLLAVRAGNARVAIVRPEGDASVPALGDFRRTLQILVNLIGNAMRYTPPGGQVVVEAFADGDAAGVRVTDHGKGIAVADQARIFDKFERLDPAEAGGNGLGLYIARRLARAMDGDLSVESAPGSGARFTLTLLSRESLPR